AKQESHRFPDVPRYTTEISFTTPEDPKQPKGLEAEEPVNGPEDPKELEPEANEPEPRGASEGTGGAKGTKRTRNEGARGPEEPKGLVEEPKEPEVKEPHEPATGPEELKQQEEAKASEYE
ncbi:hypothetical protein H0H81_000134, partial [Sphagnurus paluster]